MDKTGRNRIGSSTRGCKAVVFDVDGTLYRLRALQRAMQFHFLCGHWHGPGEAMRVHRAVSPYRLAIDDLREVPASGRHLKDKQIEIAARASKLDPNTSRLSLQSVRCFQLF
jgi:FMN phosphatase YigB (HAD superfamily)